MANEKENKNTPTTATAQSNGEKEKRGPGRPTKEEAGESPYKFRAGVFLTSMGFNVENIQRSTDNKFATSRVILKIGGKENAVFMVEREGSIAIFKDATLSQRDPYSLLQTLKELGVDPPTKF